MKKLKIFEKEDENFTEIPEGFVGDIKYVLYEGSYPYIDPITLNNTTIEQAQKEALDKLKKQQEYRATNEDLWATFSIEVGGKWKEDFDKRVKLEK